MHSSIGQESTTPETSPYIDRWLPVVMDINYIWFSISQMFILRLSFYSVFYEIFRKSKVFCLSYFRYGDKVPRSVAGRLFGVVWINVGLVILAIFMGMITASLFSNSLEQISNLYGMPVNKQVLKTRISTKNKQITLVILNKVH